MNWFETLVLGMELGLVVGAMLGFIIKGIRIRCRYKASLKYLKGLLDRKGLNNPIVRAMIWRAFLEGKAHLLMRNLRGLDERRRSA